MGVGGFNVGRWIERAQMAIADGLAEPPFRVV